jgi:uncharacterized membrane protein (UPF0127 family)
MKIVVLKTPFEQSHGLQYATRIEPDTAYVFPFIEGGTSFHSRNVPEPFDIGYFTKRMKLLKVSTVVPPHQTDTAPEGTFIAIEAKAGNLKKWGFTA